MRQNPVPVDAMIKHRREFKWTLFVWTLSERGTRIREVMQLSHVEVMHTCEQCVFATPFYTHAVPLVNKETISRLHSNVTTSK